MKLAAEAGANVTEIVQFAAAATVLPQVFVSVKSAAFAPVIPMLVMLSAAVPGFESVTVCAVDVALTCVDGNAIDVGLSTACAVPVAVMVNVTELDVPPPGVGFVTVTAGVAAVANIGRCDRRCQLCGANERRRFVCAIELHL